MDELEISGKRYISSKRIAREHKYHPDYMGQLIRGGKVQGTKVGRAWYVDEASFAEYLGQERNPTLGRAELSQNPSAPQRGEFSAPTPLSAGRGTDQSVGAENSPTSGAVAPAYVSATLDSASAQSSRMPEQEVLEKNSAPADASLGASGESSEFFREKLPAEAPTIVEITKKIEVRPTRIHKPTLTYISDSSPLFPEIRKNIVPIRTSQPVEQKIQQIAAIQKEILEPKPSNLAKYIGGGALIVVGIVVFAFVFFGSVGYDSVLNVEQGKPASAAMLQEKTFCFIFNDCQK